MQTPPRSRHAVQRRFIGRRACPRVRLHVPARVTLLIGVKHCLLEDLSQTGARLSLGGPIPRPGADLLVSINELELFGIVVWARETGIGMVFDEALSLPQVIKMRNYADGYAKEMRAAALRQAREFVLGPLWRSSMP